MLLSHENYTTIICCQFNQACNSSLLVVFTNVIRLKKRRGYSNRMSFDLLMNGFCGLT
jgi:hypothetical protein